MVEGESPIMCLRRLTIIVVQRSHSSVVPYWLRTETELVSVAVTCQSIAFKSGRASGDVQLSARKFVRSVFKQS